MVRVLGHLFCALFLSSTAFATDLRVQIRGASPPVKVMLLGVWHFSNPGQDQVNLTSDDVTKPARQKELQRLADPLAGFRPTRIMLERVVDAPGFVDPRFATFGPEALTTERGEAVQIGCRLARQLGLAHVYGIDEQSGPGEPDYFPFDAFAASVDVQGRRSELDALMNYAGARMATSDAMQKSQSIPAFLAAMNTPEVAPSEQGLYYSLLPFSTVSDQPGADLNARYYLRNAKIFSKLRTIVEPGDRVLAVFGAGHAFWLRHFASLSPGFQSVDPSPYLRRAARAR